MIADIVEKNWDVIVIGAGMGGGVVGRRLAEKGMSVLFVESGPDAPRREERALDEDLDNPDERSSKGYWPERLTAVVDGRSSKVFGPLGTGIGGTSALYAATLERPERHDMDDSAAIPHPTGGWPIGYDAFLPYLEEAEALLHVCGEPDPLSPEPASMLRTAPPLSPGDAAMMEAFRREGLHPYRKHVGVRYLPGCTECFGRRCPRACKMDGRSAGVEPALATGRAALIDGCSVRALRGARGQVTHLDAICGGAAIKLKARRFILAAGALGSPRLLLASASEDWPAGCANETDLVGRNLMFHIIERIAIWPERRADFNGPVNTISMRDFYQQGGVRFGHLQSMGLSASYGDLVHILNQKFDRSAGRALRPLRGLVRIPALAAARALGDARIFQGILEDLPYLENRVVLDAAHPDRIRFEYTFFPELLERRKTFRDSIKKGLGRQRSFFMQVKPELEIPHSCGTLCFGTDPAKSVLNPSCRAHGVDNLYVTDSSFMPTSTGINPSLTIAANALRVADRIVAEQTAESGPRRASAALDAAKQGSGLQPVQRHRGQS